MSTFQRLFGAEPEAARKGAQSPSRDGPPSILPIGETSVRRPARKSWPQAAAAKGLDTGLSNEDSSDKLLGPRKKRIQEPGFSPNVGGALSPRSQGWSGSPRSPSPRTPFGDLPDTPEKEWRPLRRRRPSNENATVALPPWVLPGNVVSPRSASPRSPRSPRLSSPASPASLWVPEKDRRVTTWTNGYDVDTYRYIKVFPDSIQYKSCLALQPTRSPSPSDVEKAEHDGIWGPDGLLRGACRRRISPNARGTMSSIAFTPPPSPATDVGSPTMSPTVAADKLQGLQTRGGHQGPFPVLGGVPRKRMQRAPDSPSNAAEEASPDTAGMRSPRFSWSSGMVPDRQTVQPPATADDLPRRMAVDAVSPRSLIRPAATLATGLSAEDPDAVNETFLGARKGRSPRGSRTPSPGGAFGGNSPSLSWGAVSAGGYGVDVASRGAAGAWCNRSFNNVRPAEAAGAAAAVTYKEPQMRRRERAGEQRSTSPLRWR